MADSPELKIHIVSDADNSGFKSAAASSSELKGAIGSQTDATGALGQETEKSAEKVKLFAGSGVKMHKVMREISHVSPILGTALKVALNPIGGSILAAIGLFVKMKEHIKEVNAELDALAAKAAEPDFLAGIRAKQQVLADAAAAALTYSAHLDSVAAAERSITAQLTAQLALQKEMAAAKADEVSADEALENAQIKAAVAAGTLTEAEAVEAEAAVKRGKLKADSDAEIEGKTKELTAKNSAIVKLDPEGDAAIAQSARKKYEAEKARRAQSNADGKAAEGNLKHALDQVAKIDEELSGNQAYQGYLSATKRGDKDSAAMYRRDMSAPDLLGGPSAQDLLENRDRYQSLAQSNQKIVTASKQDENTNADFKASEAAVTTAEKQAQESNAA